MNPPLHNIHVIEFEGLGPGPLAGRMLSEMGARVTVIARPAPTDISTQLGGAAENPMHLGKERLLLDLKDPTNQAMAKSLVNSSDALIEGHRPGVMERLGLGPAEFAESNPKLVYGRMTGWGQSGPLAQAAGHDLNYVALTGMLALSAHRNEKPIVPQRSSVMQQARWDSLSAWCAPFMRHDTAERGVWLTGPSSTPCR
jgi:alpha-methylacyl-CoA racemase